MNRVELRIDREQLLQTMSEMRVWLDRRRFEPQSFEYHINNKALVRMNFKTISQAHAFVTAFAGAQIV